MLSRVFSRQNMSLLSEMVRTDFKLRYQGSVLGYLWSFLKPLFLFAILYVIFTKFLKFGEGEPFFSLSLLLGIIIWNFFTEATNRSVTAIVAQGDLIRKIKIPRYLIVVSTVISALINLALSLVVVAVFVLFSDVVIAPRIVLIIPLIIELVVLATAASFFLSAVFVRFRDINYIWEVVTQMVFYATPIIYPLSLIPNETARELFFINPMAQIIQDMRWAVIYDGTQTLFDSQDLLIKFVPFLLIVATIFLSIWYFRKESKHFAENV